MPVRHCLTTLGADASLVVALRAGRPLASPRLEALRVFTLAVLEARGGVSEHDLGRFVASGYTGQNAQEVVLGIGAYTISTFANRLTGAPVDEPLRQFLVDQITT